MMVAAFRPWLGKAHRGGVERRNVGEELGLERCGDVVSGGKQQPGWLIKPTCGQASPSTAP